MTGWNLPPGCTGTEPQISGTPTPSIVLMWPGIESMRLLMEADVFPDLVVFTDEPDVDAVALLEGEDVPYINVAGRIGTALENATSVVGEPLVMLSAEVTP